MKKIGLIAFLFCGLVYAEGPGMKGAGSGHFSGKERQEPGGEGPCKQKRENKHQSRQQLHQCLENWARARPEDPTPSDDCSTKLAAFIQASKDIKACFKEMKDKHQQAPQGKI